MIRFWVPGIPKAMSVGKTVRAGALSFQKRVNTDWATLVGYHGRQVAPERPFCGPVHLAMTFYMPRPKSAPKRVVEPLTRPDLDNLFHKLTDQWNGVFWVDDSQIVEALLFKKFAHAGPGVEVIVCALRGKIHGVIA